ncbi:hypothetical protein [Macellibacteroides fermentans]|uniref:hypothetical protein n=1 Tax=Macellibacteroides fermentans TaxID=879969 RepID=UPI00406D4704
MPQQEYIETGKCIWCGRMKPKATFYNKPHIVPHNIGANYIGFDICDECNAFFGTATRTMPNTNLVFKEVFNTIKFFSKPLNEQSYKNYSSAYFRYDFSKRTLKLKQHMSLSRFTKQFKRSLYEVFLQKYHSVTKNANDPKFNYVRAFARYANLVSDLKVYYGYNKVILTPPEGYIDLPMSIPLIQDINKYGFFCFWFIGHCFILEIDPNKCALYRDLFIKEQVSRFIVPVDDTVGIIEITNIFDIDFMMNRFGKTNFNTNYKLKP